MNACCCPQDAETVGGGGGGKRQKRESAQRVVPRTRTGKIITAGVVALYISSVTETQKIL